MFYLNAWWNNTSTPFTRFCIWTRKPLKSNQILHFSLMGRYSTGLIQYDKIIQRWETLCDISDSNIDLVLTWQFGLNLWIFINKHDNKWLEGFHCFYSSVLGKSLHTCQMDYIVYTVVVMSFASSYIKLLRKETILQLQLQFCGRTIIKQQFSTLHIINIINKV